MASGKLLVVLFCGLLLACGDCTDSLPLHPSPLSLWELLRGAFDGLFRSRRINSDTSGSGPVGGVVITKEDFVVCHGLYTGNGQMRVPDDCAQMIQHLATLGKLKVYMADTKGELGTVESTPSATKKNDGTTSVSFTQTGTSTAASVYTTGTSVDFATCQITSYGSKTFTPEKFTGRNAFKTALKTSAFVSSCASVLPNILSYAKVGTPDATTPNNYACTKTSAGGICEGDIGAPITCTTGGGKTVVVGMVATGKCSSGEEDFIAIDFTNKGLAGFSS